MRSGAASPSCSVASRVALPYLHLALEREHHLASLVAAGGLHVHHAEHRVARRALHPEHARLGLERVAEVDRGAEAHVDVLEVRARVLGDVLHALAEHDQHHEAGRHDETLEAVRLRVASVLRERVRGHREVGEEREQPFGDRLPALVPVDVAGDEILEKMPALLPNDRHGGGPLRDAPGGVNSRRAAARDGFSPRRTGARARRAARPARRATTPPAPWRWRGRPREDAAAGARGDRGTAAPAPRAPGSS